MAGGKMLFTTPQLSAPVWAGDFFDPDDAVVRFPAKLDASQFEDASSVQVKLTAGATGGTKEIQRITMDAAGGTFTVTFGANTTPVQAWNVTPANLKTALNALASIVAAGGVDVVGVTGVNYDIIFGTPADVAQVTCDSALLTGGSTHTATPSTLRPGVAAATALAVTALSDAIPVGTVIDFGNGKFAKVATAAAKGATAITTQALDMTILTGDIGYYRPYGTRKQIPSGTLAGRTYAEREAGADFGPAVYTDDEVFLTLRPIVDASLNSDVEFLKPGRHVKENMLPAWTAISADANLLAKLRSTYQTMKGSSL